MSAGQPKWHNFLDEGSPLLDALISG